LICCVKKSEASAAGREQKNRAKKQIQWSDEVSEEKVGFCVDLLSGIKQEIMKIEAREKKLATTPTKKVHLDGLERELLPLKVSATVREIQKG